MGKFDQHNHRTQLYHRYETVKHPGFYFHHHEVHALFDELIHRPWGCVNWTPPVDVWENETAFILEMDVPGIEQEQLEIVRQGRTLTIRGQRQLRQDAGKAVGHLHERCEGRFTRTFEFDFVIEEAAIESTRQEGVLTVIIPKPRKE